jgi:hypothetical protein
VHNSRTESSTFIGVVSLLQWTDRAGTSSNGCGDCVSSSAWCYWSPGGGVAVQQWKGQRLGFDSDFARIPLEGLPNYRGFAPRSCAARIRPQIYLQSEFEPNVGWDSTDFSIGVERVGSVTFPQRRQPCFGWAAVGLLGLRMGKTSSAIGP